MPHATQMSAGDTGLLVVDVQEKLMPLLPNAGAILVTAEAVVFEWTGGADNPRFKEVSKLVRERMKQS